MTLPVRFSLILFGLDVAATVWIGSYLLALAIVLALALGLCIGWQTARDRFQPRRERKAVRDG